METHGGIILTGEPKNSEKTVSRSATTLNEPGANPGLRCDSLVTNRLSHGKYGSSKLLLLYQNKTYIKIYSLTES
jgi:hypothetical protein